MATVQYERLENVLWIVALPSRKFLNTKGTLPFALAATWSILERLIGKPHRMLSDERLFADELPHERLI